MPDKVQLQRIEFDNHMKIGILGAGPAGLYCAILIKQCFKRAQITIIDQNPEDATFGFGIVLSDSALGFLHADDPPTADLIEPHMQTWSDICIVHKGQSVRIDGIGFAAIGRLEMLSLLRKRALELGIEPKYNRKISKMDVFGDCHIVIAADGLNSTVRAKSPEAFGEKIEYLSNRFCWFGTRCSYDALTQTFVETDRGFFNAHHYRYGEDRSTFIIECDEQTFLNYGFAQMSELKYRKICEAIFADALDGGALISNNSVWRQFPVLSNQRYFDGNRVLVGDALHSAHFSIGSGTRLAMEDAIALVNALKQTDFNPQRGFAEYQRQRQPIVDKLCTAALRSGQWYERFAEHMALSPWEFALSYVTRSARVNEDKLRRMCPNFTAELARRAISF